MKNVIKQLVIILKSRFTKDKDKVRTIKRRGVCLRCEFNSNNQSGRISYKTFFKALSDFYSWITFNGKKDNLGNCLACGCSVYFKSREADEACPKNKWKE